MLKRNMYPFWEKIPIWLQLKRETQSLSSQDWIGSLYGSPHQSDQIHFVIVIIFNIVIIMIVVVVMIPIFKLFERFCSRIQS